MVNMISYKTIFITITKCKSYKPIYAPCYKFTVFIKPAICITSIQNVLF